jgi:hypothetical protein
MSPKFQQNEIPDFEEFYFYYKAALTGFEPPLGAVAFARQDGAYRQLTEDIFLFMMHINRMQ